MDKSSAIGVTVAAAGILGGLMIDGGNVGQILQPSAAMIVLGGTLGAVMLHFPLGVVMQSMARLKTVFLHKEPDIRATVDQIIGFAHRARKSGIVSLDKELDSIDDPFLRKALMLAVDGVPAESVRQTMEHEIGHESEHAERVIQVFEAAGGYAPTIGIIGAIMGLIQVMQHLDQINEVGRGIAVAFVATIYGVAFANLAFLPMAGKLRVRRRENDLLHEMMLEGVIAIQEGMNPRMLAGKLAIYMPEETAEEDSSGEALPAAAAEPVRS